MPEPVTASASAPGQMIFLDDVVEFVDAALATGITVILFQNNEQAIADIEAALRT